MTTSSADMPVTQEMTPVLAIEVWEHAYCLDCQNERVDHVNAIIDKLLNWELALQNAGLIVLAAFDSQRREAFAYRLETPAAVTASFSNEQHLN